MLLGGVELGAGFVCSSRQSIVLSSANCWMRKYELAVFGSTGDKYICRGKSAIGGARRIDSTVRAITFSSLRR
jgi:hypothetical protein